MAETQNSLRSLNPWFLHLQKLGLELKCPSCLNLYNTPVLLPCDHILCKSCIPELTPSGCACNFCKQTFIKRDLRQARFMENILNIYRSMDAAFSKNVHKPLMNGASKSDDKQAKVQVDGSEENSSSGPSILMLSGNKRVHVPSKCHGKDESVMNNSTAKKYMSSRNPMQSDHETIDVEMNPPAQMSPESYPSVDNSKGVDSDNPDSNKANLQKTGTYLEKSCVKRQYDNSFAEEGSCCISAEGLGSIAKKPKTLNHEMHGSPDDRSPSAISNRKTEVNPISDMDFPTSQKPPLLDHLTSEPFVCEFCQSWRENENTGPISHFDDDGKPVTGGEALQPNVIHVHRKCMEWAPRIYFDEEIVKNLKQELRRGAKLKCHKCGLKGAALGCFVERCLKSYHVPCAVEIPECRWDVDNYSMLCPSHSKRIFPGEQSRRPVDKVPAVPAQKNMQQRFWEGSVSGIKQWTLCGSALNAGEKIMLDKFASMCGATVVKRWNSKVTHVIAATDSNGGCTRTFKVLMAILEGRWVLTIDWVRACMAELHPVNEEVYEVSRDNHGYLEGPKIGRQRTAKNAPKLFDGLKFFFNGDFVRTYKEDLEDLITAAGGTIFLSKDELVEHMLLCSSTFLVVYNSDSASAIESADKRAEAEKVGSETGSYVVAHTWILDSIASCKVQPFA